MSIEQEHVLVPAPRRLVREGGVCRLPARPVVDVRVPGAAGRALAAELCASLRSAGVDARPSGSGAKVVRVRIAPALFRQAQAYRLHVRQDRVEILAADLPGARYAAMTARQLCRQARRKPLPCLFIEDWPDFPARGVMLDVSRDKVPTMATLFALVDLLSELKVNQFQLYTEHTFAYREHREVWRQASPMTAAEIRKLDGYCRERFIELVPNQNSFGHMERWLKHPRYRGLSEKPDGFLLGAHRYPYGSTLCPGDPRAIKFLARLYGELLPNFASRLLNVGGDETWELGQGRSMADCHDRGKGRVYLEFLLKIHREVARREHLMQFWGDIILHHPEFIPELPDDVIALVWGYEADHPFAEQCGKFAASNRSFYVCPGTSSWNSFAGRTDNALGNLRAAAEAGIAAGAAGFLNTDWGDSGHWQPFAVSLLPYAFGAAVSWACEANRGIDLAAAANAHVFLDSAGVMANVARDLGNLSSGVGGRPGNCTNLFRILAGAMADTLFNEGPRKTVTREECLAARDGADRLLGELAKAMSRRPDGSLLKAEFRQAGDLVRLAADVGAARLAVEGKTWTGLPEDDKQAFHREFRRIYAKQRMLWLKRNRPGGIADSLGRFQHLWGPSR